MDERRITDNELLDLIADIIENGRIDNTLSRDEFIHALKVEVEFELGYEMDAFIDTIVTRMRGL